MSCQSLQYSASQSVSAVSMQVSVCLDPIYLASYSLCSQMVVSDLVSLSASYILYSLTMMTFFLPMSRYHKEIPSNRASSTDSQRQSKQMHQHTVSFCCLGIRKEENNHHGRKVCCGNIRHVSCGRRSSRSTQNAKRR
jgi:hypothetical protein